MDIIEHRRRHIFIARAHEDVTFVVITTNPEVGEVLDRSRGQITGSMLHHLDADAVIVSPYRVSFLYAASTTKESRDVIDAVESAARRGDIGALLAVRKLIDDYPDPMPDTSSPEGCRARRQFQRGVRKALDVHQPNVCNTPLPRWGKVS